MKIKFCVYAKNWFGQGRAEAELEADNIEDMKELFELSKKFDIKVKLK